MGCFGSHFGVVLRGENGSFWGSKTSGWEVQNGVVSEVKNRPFSGQKEGRFSGRFEGVKTGSFWGGKRGYFGGLFEVVLRVIWAVQKLPFGA